MPKTRSRRIRAFARAAAGGLLALFVLAAVIQPAQAQHRRFRQDRVQAVMRAARSALGTPYRYGGASPSGGFDCSGFTMWAWQHGDVRLPHNSRQQYESLPHVRSTLKRGDLLFFYRPISHVGIFIGRGRMIEAGHSGTGVRIVRVYWQYFSGAARPP